MTDEAKKNYKYNIIAELKADPKYKIKVLEQQIKYYKDIISHLYRCGITNAEGYCSFLDKPIEELYDKLNNCEANMYDNEAEALISLNYRKGHFCPSEY